MAKLYYYEQAFNIIKQCKTIEAVEHCVSFYDDIITNISALDKLTTCVGCGKEAITKYNGDPVCGKCKEIFISDDEIKEDEEVVSDEDMPEYDCKQSYDRF